MKAHGIKAVFMLFFSVWAVLLLAGPAQCVTDEELAAAIAGGQQYLFNTFTDSGETGYWDAGGTNGYDTVANTAAAIAALVETGKLSDPAYAAIIRKGVKYLLTKVQSDGSIYEDNQTYDTGLSLLALCLYDADHSDQTANPSLGLATVIENAANYFKGAQSDNAGDIYTYGGWGYEASDKNDWSDMSNTQFATMGLYYSSVYLGWNVSGSTWATHLLVFLTNVQSYFDEGPNEGAFSYYPQSSSFLAGTMTGGGLWCLAMLGKPATDSMVVKAVGWFNNNYMWGNVPGSSSAYYYFIYAMSKGLVGTIGYQAPVGIHNWVQDLRDTVVPEKQTGQVPARVTTGIPVMASIRDIPLLPPG